MIDLCLHEDEYVRHRPRWVATLEDGLVVYADDDRPGLEEPSAWLRLRAHCMEQGIGLVKLHYQFRSNVVHLPDDRAGYFFTRTAFGNSSGRTHDGARIGHVVGDAVLTRHYQTPELILLDADVRLLDPGSPNVIMRPPR